MPSGTAPQPPVVQAALQFVIADTQQQFRPPYQPCAHLATSAALHLLVMMLHCFATQIVSAASTEDRMLF